MEEQISSLKEQLLQKSKFAINSQEGNINSKQLMKLYDEAKGYVYDNLGKIQIQKKKLEVEKS